MSSDRAVQLKLYKIAKDQQKLIKKMAGAFAASEFAAAVSAACGGRVSGQEAGRSFQLTLSEGKWAGSCKENLLAILPKYKAELATKFDEIQLYEGRSLQPVEIVSIVDVKPPTFS